MYKIINEYMSKINMLANDEIYERITACLKEKESVSDFSLSVSYNHYVLDVRIKDYSVPRASGIFCEIQDDIAYPYSAIYIRFNEGQCVRYRFLTCKENKDGFYCDMIFH